MNIKYYFSFFLDYFPTLSGGGAFVPIVPKGLSPTYVAGQLKLTLMVGEADCTPTLTVILGDLEGLDAISPPSQATSRMLPFLGEIFLPFIFAPSKILAIMIHDSLFLPLRLTGPRLTR